MPSSGFEHNGRESELNPTASSRGFTDLRLSPPPPEWGVEVVEKAIATAIGQWHRCRFPAPKFDYPGPPARLRDGPWFDYSVLVVSVLACLWPPRGEQMWSIDYRGERLSDAPALFGAFTNWIGPASRPDLRPFSEFEPTEALRLFAGRGVLQMVTERGVRIAEVAGALLERWEGAALHLVEEAGWNGTGVAELLASTIPGFEDEVSVGGHRLRFRKLAHLAAAIMASRSSRPWSGLDSFPVYPDYMLPRFLRHLGIIRYSPRLAEEIDSRTEIPRHSEEEAAIRWATVRAGHLLVEALSRTGVSITGPRLDYFLWSEAVLGPDASRMGEHHRTVTLDY